MTMSRFRAAPRRGHLERLKRMYGYLKKFSQLHFVFELMNLTSLIYQNRTLIGVIPYTVMSQSYYPRMRQNLLAKAVTTVTYTDANLYHDMLTGRSVTGVLHLCNQTLLIGLQSVKRQWKRPRLVQNSQQQG